MVFRSAPMREAMEAHDNAAVENLLAEDVVLHSPMLSAPFEGRPAVAPLLAVVRDGIEDFRITHQLSDGTDEILVFGGRIRGEELEASILLRFDDNGLVRDFTAFFRPLRALAEFAAVAGAPLAKSRPRGAFLRAMSPLLGLMAAQTDWISRRNLRMR